MWKKQAGPQLRGHGGVYVWEVEWEACCIGRVGRVCVDAARMCSSRGFFSSFFLSVFFFFSLFVSSASSFYSSSPSCQLSGLLVALLSATFDLTCGLVLVLLSKPRRFSIKFAQSSCIVTSSFLFNLFHSHVVEIGLSKRGLLGPGTDHTKTEHTRPGPVQSMGSRKTKTKARAVGDCTAADVAGSHLGGVRSFSSLCCRREAGEKEKKGGRSGRRRPSHCMPW